MRAALSGRGAAVQARAGGAGEADLGVRHPRVSQRRCGRPRRGHRAARVSGESPERSARSPKSTNLVFVSRVSSRRRSYITDSQHEAVQRFDTRLLCLGETMPMSTASASLSVLVHIFLDFHEAIGMIPPTPPNTDMYVQGEGLLGYLE